MQKWQKIDTEVVHVTDWLGVNVEGRQGVGLRFGLCPCCPLSLGLGHFLV